MKFSKQMIEDFQVLAGLRESENFPLAHNKSLVEAVGTHASDDPGDDDYDPTSHVEGSCEICGKEGYVQGGLCNRCAYSEDPERPEEVDADIHQHLRSPSGGYSFKQSKQYREGKKQDAFKKSNTAIKRATNKAYELSKGARIQGNLIGKDDGNSPESNANTLDDIKTAIQAHKRAIMGHHEAHELIKKHLESFPNHPLNDTDDLDFEARLHHYRIGDHQEDIKALESKHRAAAPDSTVRHAPMKGARRVSARGDSYSEKPDSLTMSASHTDAVLSEMLQIVESEGYSFSAQGTREEFVQAVVEALEEGADLSESAQDQLVSLLEGLTDLTAFLAKGGKINNVAEKTPENEKAAKGYKYKSNYRLAKEEEAALEAGFKTAKEHQAFLADQREQRRRDKAAAKHGTVSRNDPYEDSLGVDPDVRAMDYNTTDYDDHR